MKILLCFLVAVVSGLMVSAQVPPQISAMNDLPNAGQLYIDYCSPHPGNCVHRKALCYGQCCTQFDADVMGYACAGNIEGTVPRGFTYSGWSCVQFESGKVLRGKATKGYDTKNCHNLR